MAALDSFTAKQPALCWAQSPKPNSSTSSRAGSVSRSHQLRSKVVCSALYGRLCSPDALIQ